MFLPWQEKTKASPGLSCQCSRNVSECPGKSAGVLADPGTSLLASTTKGTAFDQCSAADMLSNWISGHLFSADHLLMLSSILRRSKLEQGEESACLAAVSVKQ